MKIVKLFYTATVACLLTVILPGSAYADLAEIIDEYCEEIAFAADDAGDELREANNDLDDCINEYNDCRTGIFEDDPVDCIAQYKRCIDRGRRDQTQACNSFLREFTDETRQAERRADRDDVEDEFKLWFFSPASDECLASAQATAFACATIIDE